jgi:Tfp pilus assembly protein PilF
MGKRIVWCLACLCLGCSGLSLQPAPDNDDLRHASHQSKPEESPKDCMRQAAACMEAGDDAGALPHLQAYLAAHPDHVIIRAHLAELLLRLHQQSEARREFERYLSEAPSQGEMACRHVIHAHTRLVEIAREENNAYQEHLHRGIGLFLLARQVAGAEAKDEDPDPEPMLFKAIAQLNKAAKDEPAEARPHWYLYLAWSQLGQMHPARTSLLQARQLANQSDLPAEEFAALQATH